MAATTPAAAPAATLAASPSAPGLRPPPGHPRFPLLDPLRGIAAMMVLTFHVALISGFTISNPLGAYTARLDLGVTIFFVLSAFLLYRPFVASRRHGLPPVRWRDYARRRVLRIVPGYWVALVVLAAYPGLFGWGEHWWRFLTFTQIYWAQSATQGIGAAWSLAIEASFYVALPLAAAMIARWRPSARAELAILLGVAVAADVVRSVLHATGSDAVAQFTLVSYLDWFCLGMGLAVVSVAAESRGGHGRGHGRAGALVARRPWLAWALAAALLWLVAQMLGGPGRLTASSELRYMASHVGYGLAALLVVLPAVIGTAGGGWLRRALGRRWLRWLGVISYGVFLYHGPLLYELARHGAAGWLPGSQLASTWLVLVAVVLVVASASYVLVERPALRLKDRRQVPAAVAAPSSAGG